MTYAYKCESCGHTFDKQLSMNDRMIPCSEACPECGVVGEVKRDFIGENAFFTMNGERLMSTKRNKPDREFRNLLGKIKKDSGGSGNIDRFT